MAVKVSTWDASEYLETEEDIAAYLNAVVEEGDPTLLQAALGDVAKARGMTSIARDAGVSRESLYTIPHTPAATRRSRPYRRSPPPSACG